MTKLQELDAAAAKLLEAARKLAPGLERHSLKEIGIFRVKIAELTNSHAPPRRGGAHSLS